jgi:urease beta subunit
MVRLLVVFSRRHNFNGLKVNIAALVAVRFDDV